MSGASRAGWGSSARVRRLPARAARLLVILFSFTDRAISNFPINALVAAMVGRRCWRTRQFPPALGNSLIIGAAVGVDLGRGRHDGGDGLCAPAAAPLRSSRSRSSACR